MLVSHPRFLDGNNIADNPPVDIFIGLNGVRVLSIIALLLVFSSNIVTLVHDVQAVNKFLAAGEDKDLTDCDYIEQVLSHISVRHLFIFFQRQHRPKPGCGHILGRSQPALDHLSDCVPHPVRGRVARLLLPTFLPHSR